jgi:4-hydroxy-tetrahydrodipicolinate reductase
MPELKIGVVGAAGRMGRMLVAEIARTEGVVLSGAGESAGNPTLGQDAGELAGIGALGVALGDDAAALIEGADVLIDFTSPEATARHAGLAADCGTAHIIGTTGFDETHQAAIEAAASKTAIVQAPNMSLGVNLLFALTERVAGALGEDYDIEIFEIHHRHKVDAPSGTALGLGQAAARGRRIDLEDVAERGRDGITGARARGGIGFASLRGGDVVGDHTVTFAGEGERIELTHRAGSRLIYASGAVRAALWAHGKPPGLYGMKDVLGI